MNKQYESTYALLVGSEETGRDLMEIAIYALATVCTVFSIWQFALQPNALPIDGVTASGQGRAPKGGDVNFRASLDNE